MRLRYSTNKQYLVIPRDEEYDLVTIVDCVCSNGQSSINFWEAHAIIQHSDEPTANWIHAFVTYDFVFVKSKVINA